MANEVSICNRALTHIRARTIQSLSESTREARACNTFFEDTRDSVLEDFPWNFASKEQALAELSGESFSGWDHVYQYPSDCVKAREIYNSLSQIRHQRVLIPGGEYITEVTRVQADKIEFEIKVKSDFSSRVLLTNQDEAILFYTARVTNPTVFSSEFVDAFSVRLAAELAISIKGNANLRTSLMTHYLTLINQAEASDANEGHKDPSVRNSFVEARG